MWYGPNMTRLIALRFTQIAVPIGVDIDSTLKRLARDTNRVALVSEAEQWARDVVTAAVSDCPDLYGTDEEETARSILVKLCDSAPADGQAPQKPR